MKCKQSDKFSDECTVLTTASMPKVLWLKSNSENKTASQKKPKLIPHHIYRVPNTYCFDFTAVTFRASSLVHFHSVK